MIEVKKNNESIWVDDTFLGLSPEQKLLFLFLHTNPYVSPCGIYLMQTKTMAFQMGLTEDSFEGAMRGLEAAIPDLVMIDWKTKEVALLQYSKQILIIGGNKVLPPVDSEIEKVNSQILLREFILENSALISKPYLDRLKQLQMEEMLSDAASKNSVSLEENS